MAVEKQIQVEKEKEKFIEFIGGYVSTRAEHTIHWMEELIKQIRRDDI